MNTGTSVERWGIFELRLPGPTGGNPFVKVSFGAEFAYQHRVVPVTGFYDGDGAYVVRFSPDTLGAWRYTTTSNVSELAGKAGALTCVAPSAGNHGPVQVTDTYHFAYADGTRYYQLGTTCYVWNHQGEVMERQTLETLKSAPFNKIRFCIFPKDYLYNHNEPDYFAFEGNLKDGFDLARFNPAFWRHLERRIAELLALGIQADLILFHPYDRWGFSAMAAETDDFYLRYAVARLTAYRNVWWSMANEFDLMKAKTLADWDRFFRVVQASDPYQRLRSVHNCYVFYDHAKPWVTHQSIQHGRPEMTREWRDLYQKPVVIDETKYEGNIEMTWGNIPAQEMVRKFWEATVRGGYCGHGETYRNAEEVLWWSKGGVLHGSSPARLAFLKIILEDGPQVGFEPVDKVLSGYACAGKTLGYLLTYFGFTQPEFMPLSLPEGQRYAIEVLDTWEMTITPLEGVYSGNATLALPAKPYLALRLRAV
jgi:hypothetical protein